MKKFKRFSAFLCVLALLFTAAGCDEAAVKKTTPDFKTDVSLSKVDSGIIAENENYKLIWDADKKTVLMGSASDEFIGSTPYGAYLNPAEEGLALVALNSPVSIKYVDTKSGQMSETRSYSGVELSGRTSVSKIKNGIRIEYYFDLEQIMVPLELVLRKDSLLARIDVAKIQEKELLLTEISVLPYMASVQNSESAMVFVPSGSGAVISAANSPQGKTYSEAVFGNDLSTTKKEEDTTQSQVYLPVFGASNGNGSAVVGIIEEGAEKASIKATAGDPEIGYSSAWASFQLRSKDSINVKAMSNYETTKTVFSDNIVDDKYLSVAYYPLSGEKSNIAGMAECYRNYLSSKGLKSNKQDEKLLYLNVVGGEMVETSVLSIPIKKLHAATTLTKAQDIAEQMKTELGNDSLLLNLYGYGKSGLTAGKPAGGMTVASALGGVKGYKSFSKWCTDNGIPMFLNFDLIRFSSAGSGISSWGDVAKTANNARAIEYHYDYETREKDDDFSSSLIVSRSKLSELSEKLMKKTAKWDLSGISFSGISKNAYSDGESYISKDDMDKDTEDIINSWKKANHKVMTVSPNSYAAAASDYIISAPTGSSKYDCFSYDVPFYQMVFKGMVPLSSSPINLCANARTEFLNAVSTGSGLCFSTYATHNKALQDSPHSLFISGEYDVIKEDILAMAKEAKALNEALKGAKIKDYSKIGDVTRTVFDNGISVYANYGDTEAATPIGNVAAEGFLYGQEGM